MFYYSNYINSRAEEWKELVYRKAIECHSEEEKATHEYVASYNAIQGKNVGLKMMARIRFEEKNPPTRNYTDSILIIQKL